MGGLWRLGLPETGTIDSLNDRARLSNFFQGILNRYSGDNRSMQASAVDATKYGGPVDKRPSGIVHQDKGYMGGQGIESGTDRFLTGFAARAEDDLVCQRSLDMAANQISRQLQVVCGHRYHHDFDGLYCQEGLTGANQDGDSGQGEKLFWFVAAEAEAEAASRNNNACGGKLKRIVVHVSAGKKGVNYKPSSVSARKRTMII